MIAHIFSRRIFAAGIAALAGLVHGSAFLAPAHGADPLVYLIDGYIPRFTQKKEMNRLYASTFDELQRAILSRQAKGQSLECSVQMLTEVSWLIQYTNLKARVEERLADLRQSLDLPAERQRAALEQSPVDGSWGGCFEEWFLRAWASADPAKELAHRGQRLTHPLKFLDRIDSPEKIRAHMAAIKISRAGTEGRDHRKELNLTVTGLGQLLFLKELAPMFSPAWPRDAVATSLAKFMDQEWQDPDTGYWGPWYEVDGKIVKTEDLSTTFHIASYRGGNVPLLEQLVRKTLRIRDRPYPFGWHDRGTQNNHHSYDVVRLLRFGWPQMSLEERAKAQAELFIIAARARRLSVNGVGEFDMRPYSSIEEAYYFGVSLFDEIGYFRESKRFWMINWKPDDAEELRAQILANIERFGINSPMMAEARRKLVTRD
jgi:hypothetical protein